MKQYLNRIAKWLAAVVVAIAFAQSIVLPASADIIYPGDDFSGPLVPEFQIHAVDCPFGEVGIYAFETSVSPMPLTVPNFVPCEPPYALDTIYPPGSVGQDTVTIHNIGNVPLDVVPVFN